MKYENIIMKGDTNCVRYLLEKKGDKMLFFIGINPSTANEENPDPTIKRVMGFAESNACDGFAMLNLYPQRSTNPNSLHKESCPELHSQNLTIYKELFVNTRNPIVVVAFGNNICIRKFLKDCLRDIAKVLSPYHPQWKRIGELTCKGNPRHPLYARYEPLQDFDIVSYLK